MKASKNFGTLMTKTSASKVKVQKSSAKSNPAVKETMSKSGKMSKVKLQGNGNGKNVNPCITVNAKRSITTTRQPAKMAMKNIPVGKKSISLALGKVGHMKMTGKKAC